jgi:hypothetical protein
VLKEYLFLVIASDLGIFGVYQIILSQEKSIQQLNELVQSLQLQLLHCRGSNNTILSSKNSTSNDVSEVEDHDAVQD